MNFAGCCAEKKHANQELDADAGSLHLENRELDADAGSLHFACLSMYLAWGAGGAPLSLANDPASNHRFDGAPPPLTPFLISL